MVLAHESGQVAQDESQTKPLIVEEISAHRAGFAITKAKEQAEAANNAKAASFNRYYTTSCAPR